VDLPAKGRPQRRTTIVSAAISPVGPAVAAGSAGLTLVAGAPVGAAVAVAVSGWVGSVTALWAVRRVRQQPAPMDPFTVGEPWRSFVFEARRHRRRYSDTVQRLRPGPLRDRLDSAGQRVDAAVDEVGQIARAGHDLTTARRQIADAAGRGLPATPGDDDPAVARARQAQADTAARLDESIEATRRRLTAMDAQLGESVTRAIEIAAGADVDAVLGLESTLETLVDEMESLRLALGETVRRPPPELT
jgi:hypothetical protein